MARKTPSFLGVEVLRARGEPNAYLVLGEWESYEVSAGTQSRFLENTL